MLTKTGLSIAESSHAAKVSVSTTHHRQRLGLSKEKKSQRMH